MPGGPSSAWLHSIDATYELVEVPEVREKYPVLAQKVAATITACEEALRDYGWHHCALSFNGGKDCTVLAHILTAVLRRLNGCESHQSVPTIESLYVACSQPFTEVEQFIEYAASEETGYHLILHTTKGDLKTALTEYKEGEKGKDITAIFIGVRRDDPQGSTIHVRSKCDPSWPPIMRIHPLLDWEYEDVWAFLRCPHLRVGATSSHVPSYVAGQETGVPYCALYDQGYTSLGSQYNTIRNPELNIPGTDTYDPAYKLRDGSLERAGRLKDVRRPTST